MGENGDNIIPFRPRKTTAPKPVREGPQRSAPGSEEANSEWDLRPSLAPRIRQAPMPRSEIELDERLAALTFLPPDEFLCSIANLKGETRRMALHRESGLLNTKMSNDHRVTIMAGDAGKNPELDYREHYRIKLALDKLAEEFGRAALFNARGAAIALNQGAESKWHRDAAFKPEYLYLRNNFTIDEVSELLRPRLKPTQDYVHERYDMSYRNC